MPIFHRSLNRTTCIVLVCGCCFTEIAAAADAPVASGTSEPAAALTPATRESLDQIAALVTRERWDDAAVALRSLIERSAPGSYDLAMAHLRLAQNLLNRNGGINHRPPDWTDAIPSLEHAMNSGFWPKSQTMKWKIDLANSCALADQPAKAEHYVREWLEETDQPTAEAYGFYASLLLQRAADAQNTEGNLVEQALKAVNQGLLIGADPNTWLLLLKANSLERLDRCDEAAETLEFFLYLKPNQAGQWRELFDLYAKTGQNIRAGLAFERARKHGFEIFAPEPRSWFVDAGLTEIETLKERARTRADGTLELEIACRYFAREDKAQAQEYLEAGLKKGVEQPANALLFAAYLTSERKEFSDAAALLQRAEPLIENDRQRRDFEGLREVIDAALTKESLERAKSTDPTNGKATAANPAAGN